MLLVMWTVAPNGWDLWCLARVTELPPGTARTSERINAIDHAGTGDHGTCSLPRHTIRERID
jgi:hypothetical protein